MQSDLTSTVVGVSSASMGAVTVGLALRLGTRIMFDRKLAWDDGLVLLSWLLGFRLSVLIVTDTPETRYGLGKHWDTFDVTYIDIYLKLITMSSVTYTFAIMTAKASLAALYLTVFRGRSCLLHILNQGLLLFLVCEAIEEIAVVTSQCLPTIGAWSSTGPGACVNLKPFWWTTFACYMATNILLFFQPIPFLWSKGLPSYDLATLVGIAIFGILDTLTDTNKNMRRLTPTPSRRGKDWGRYNMYVEPLKGKGGRPFIVHLSHQGGKYSLTSKQTTTRCPTSGPRLTCNGIPTTTNDGDSHSRPQVSYLAETSRTARTGRGPAPEHDDDDDPVGRVSGEDRVARTPQQPHAQPVRATGQPPAARHPDPDRGDPAPAAETSDAVQRSLVQACTDRRGGRLPWQQNSNSDNRRRDHGDARGRLHDR
ncbi:hypothetical protein PG997_005550 [Apiospora hydei]|uniref:Rhodopsin domain-containing protein n=1 Tax=Apiospora hydei TaxID=1337664 RepID=A0ABR1WL66_9PEZI